MRTGARGPLLVILAEATQEASMFSCIVLRRDNEVPGLLIGRGSGPPGRFPKAQQLFTFHRAISKGPWTPASLQQCLDWIRGFSRFFHRQRSMGCQLPLVAGWLFAEVRTALSSPFSA
jgi:hypothetical protein